MSLADRAGWRHLLRHPGQAAAALTGIALGVAAVVAVDLANTSAERAFRLALDQITGRATHQIVGGPGGLDEALYVRLRLEAGLRATAPVIEAYGEAAGEPLRLLGVDPLAEAEFRDYAAQNPASVRALLTEDGAALLAAGSAARLGLAPGQSFDLRLGGRRHVLTLAGVIAPPLGAAEVEGLIITDIATAQELTNTLGHLSWIDLRVPEGPRGGRMLAAVERLLAPGAQIVTAAARPQALAQMTLAFRTNLTAMSLLALLIGMFLIYNSMSFAVVQRRRLLGSLRLLGVTRGGVLAVVLREAALLGAAGTALGLVLGVALGQGLVQLVARTITDHYFVITVTRLQLTPAPLLTGAALGLATTLLAALVPALEAAGTNPRAALRRAHLELAAHRLAHRLALAGCVLIGAALLLAAAPGRSLAAGFLTLFACMLGMTLLSPIALFGLARLAVPVFAARRSTAARLAIRGVAAALSRTGVAVAALMLAVSATVGVGVMVASFRASVAAWLESTLRADIYVTAPDLGSERTSSQLDPGLIQRLRALPGVSAVSQGRRVTLTSDAGLVDLFALALSDGLAPRYPLRNGDPARVWPAFLSGAAVLISEPLAYRRGLGVGDSIELPTDDGPRQFPIAGVYIDYRTEHGEVLMHRALYERHYRDRAVSGLGLYLAPGAALKPVMDAVRAASGGAVQDGAVIVRANRELREMSLRIFDRTFAITTVLRALAVIVAAVGILSALLALQLERTRELAILRALGLTPGEAARLATVQTGFLGLAAGLLAVPAGLVLAQLLIHVINRRAFGWGMATVVPGEILGEALGLALGTALVAGLYPAWRMARIAPAAALREE